MITPEEIKQQAERKYLPFLRAGVLGKPFFPLDIRFRKARAGDDYLVLRDWVRRLLVGSKAERGFGYEVVLEERELRRYGRQSLPAQITIETEADYLRLIGKLEEFAQWQTAVSHTISQFPQLKEWLAQFPQRVLPYVHIWDNLIAVCDYFVTNPRPNLYLRELPVPVHTKFIEENQTILRYLLDALLSSDAILINETQFERRFGLCYDEPQIRLRLLDDLLQCELVWPATDLSLTLSDCKALEGMNDRTILIVENKMTFLTLPPVKNGAAIWGKGFQVSLLREVNWLVNCNIWYWGDLDAQGFAILSQLRSYWPRTRSLLMNSIILEKYRGFVVAGTPVARMVLLNLEEEESAVYRQLIDNNWRLEQERVRQEDVLLAIGRMGN
jgi:hypothetical protein